MYSNNLINHWFRKCIWMLFYSLPLNKRGSSKALWMLLSDSNRKSVNRRPKTLLIIDPLRVIRKTQKNRRWIESAYLCSCVSPFPVSSLKIKRQQVSAFPLPWKLDSIRSLLLKRRTWAVPIEEFAKRISNKVWSDTNGLRSIWLCSTWHIYCASLDCTSTWKSIVLNASFVGLLVRNLLVPTLLATINDFNMCPACEPSVSLDFRLFRSSLWRSWTRGCPPCWCLACLAEDFRDCSVQTHLEEVQHCGIA